MKDYSRKARNDYQYKDWMKAVPEKSIWNPILERNPELSEFSTQRNAKSSLAASVAFYLKQSMFKKPYLDQGFPEMEDVWLGPPGIPGRPGPQFDQPWTMQNWSPPPGIWILHAFTGDYFCPDETRTVIVHGTHPIYNLEFTFPSVLGAGTSFSASGLGTPTITMELTADAAESGFISFSAYMEAFDAPPQPSTQGRGWTGFLVPGHSESSCKCDEPAAFTAGLSNPETIARSTSESVSVVGGVTPYDWSVSGTDFTMDNAQTAGLTNTLISGGTSCGSATITVTDFCGQTVEIIVRSTTGRWVQKSSDVCVLSGAGTYLGKISGGGQWPTYELISGNKKQTAAYYYCWQCSTSHQTDGCSCYDGLSTSNCWNHNPCGDHRECITFDCNEVYGMDGTYPCCNQVYPPGRLCRVMENKALKYYEWEC